MLEEHTRLLQEEGTTSKVKHNLTWRKIDVDGDEGRTLTGVERPRSDSSESKKRKTKHEAQEVKNSDEISLDLSSGSDQDTPAPSAYGTASSRPAVSLGDAQGNTDGPSSEPDHGKPTGETDVSEELRSQLPASFARPQPDTNTPVNLPLPKDIFNKNTQFLALDKCLPNRDFLQLLEIPSLSVSDGTQLKRPYRLQYDKEWLAITRVFAKDLRLGDPSAKPPLDKGDAFYKPQIIEAEDWIEENVVKPGKLDVPENFTPTAPFYDPNVPATTTQAPPEYNNPQTAQFCDLIGIENKFYLTDEERQQRANAGPRPSEPRMGGGGRFARRGNASLGRSRGRGGRSGPRR
jgi:lariat debranching enzyme